MTIVIIDDNLSDIQYCKELLHKNFNTITILDCFSDAIEGLRFVNENYPDLLILDVKMPDLNGFDLLHRLKSTHTEVIFYTSHAEFSLDAYRHLALGFLLKPVNEAEFVSIVTKAIQRMEIGKKDDTTTDENHLSLQVQENKIIAIPTLGCTYFSQVTDIVRLESVDGYAKIHLVDGNIHVSSYGIKFFEKLLTEPLFFRVHKSHLINLGRVKKLFPDGTLVMDTGERIPVSRRKRAKLLEFF